LQRVTTTKYTKEAMFPHTSTWTLNEFVLVGGDATSDNPPPRFSQIQYAWRSPFLGIQQQIYMVPERNARHVALGHRDPRRSHQSRNDGSDLRQYGARRRAALFRRGA
jgi:hypothetical protein